MGTSRMRAGRHDIPRHTTNPKVTRIVRLQINLTTEIQSVSVTWQQVLYQDGLDYLGTVTTPRYTTLRIINVRVYFDWNLTNNAGNPGLSVIETSTGTEFTDIPTGGISVANVGMLFSFPTRSYTASDADTNPICTIGFVYTAGASTNVNVYADFLVEFQ